MLWDATINTPEKEKFVGIELHKLLELLLVRVVTVIRIVIGSYRLTTPYRSSFADVPEM